MSSITLAPTSGGAAGSSGLAGGTELDPIGAPGVMAMAVLLAGAASPTFSSSGGAVPVVPYPMLAAVHDPVAGTKASLTIAASPGYQIVIRALAVCTACATGTAQPPLKFNVHDGPLTTDARLFTVRQGAGANGLVQTLLSDLWIAATSGVAVLAEFSAAPAAGNFQSICVYYNYALG